MELTTKTAKRLKDLKDYGYDIVFDDEYRRIISMKDEIKKIHDLEECACWHTDYKCGYGIIIQEIGQVQNGKI